MLSKFFNLSRLKAESYSTIIRRIDWHFSKSILRKKYIRRRVQGFDMYLDVIVPGISKTLAVQGKREEDMTELVRRTLKPGMTVLDCGSNIGYYPLLAASLVGTSGKVICIEPDPRNFKLLQLNLDESPLSKIFTKFHLAVSDRKGEVSLGISSHSNLNKVVREQADDKTNIYKIKSDSIKNLIDEYGWTPDYLRMDIEGHEVEVLKGMRGCLNSFKAGFTIFLELHPGEYSDSHSFEGELRHLLENGFSCKYLVSAGGPTPPLYIKYGYSPTETIKSDGMIRGVYSHVKNNEHIISLTCSLPKPSRYIMLVKDKME